MKKVTVFGGGVGGSAVIQALLRIPEVHVSGLVNTTDNGGHSGKIRKELGIIPPGDIRRVILSMVPDSVRRHYEFRDETGVVGNKLLAELINTRGTVEGIRAFVSVFPELAMNQFNVWPISAVPTDICMIVNGQRYHGQIEVMFGRPRGSFGELLLDPDIELLPEAEKSISEAETIIIAPSGVIGSIAPILLAKGVKELIGNKRLIWFSPLFSLPTDGSNPWADYMRIVADLAKIPDLTVVNSTPLDEKVKRLYQERGFYLIRPEKVGRLQMKELLGEIPGEPPGVVATPFPRYFLHIQHDVEKLRETLLQLDL